MKRTAALLTTILVSVATAAALTVAVATMAQPGGWVVSSTNARAAQETVRRFYDTVNEALATGDVAPVEAALAPEFVEHDVAPGVSADRAGFVARLLALRAAFPTLRLAVDALSTDGIHLVAHVRAEEGDRGQIAGVSLSAPGGAWSPVDRFRVAGDRIAERWATPGRTTVVEPLAAATAELEAAVLRYIGLEHIALAPGDKLLRWIDSDPPRLMLVVSGALTLDLDESSKEPALIEPGGGGDQPAGRAIAPGQEGTVAAGEQVVLAGDGRHPFVLRNDTGAPAEALAVTLTPPEPAPPDPAWATEPAAPEPGAVTLLAGGSPELLPHGNATIRIAHAVLAPGASLLPVEESGPVVVAVQSGQLLVAADPRLAWITEAPGARSYYAGIARLEAGGGVQLLSPGIAALTSTGRESAELLIVTIAPIPEAG